MNIQSIVESVGADDTIAVHYVAGRRLLDTIHIGPNLVHVGILRRDGRWEDLGFSRNLQTNAGFDWNCRNMGGVSGSTSGTPATATSATSLTATGTPWTASQFVGWRVYAGSVYGNVGANTTSVLTVDQWWNADDTLGTTPTSTSAFGLAPGQSSARFIGLTTDATAPAATDTTLASEITTGGCARALGTFAHTAGTKTYTLTKSFSVTATFTAIDKAGCFTCATNAAGGVMAFETLLNVAATVASGDTLQITWTWTLS